MTDADKPRKSQAAELADLADRYFYIALDDQGEPIAIADGGANIALPLRGRGGLRQALASIYRREHGKPPGSQALSDALLALEGAAEHRDRLTVHLRVGRDREAIIVDLGDPHGRALEITPGSWRVRARSPILFRRTALTGRIPDPVTGGDVQRLRDLVNVSDATFPLLLAWLLSTWLLCDRPAPLLSLSGEQGTGKSTAQRLIVETVDPSPAPLRTAPRDVGDWITAAAGSRVVGLDNVSTIAPWLSDALCRAVTGEGMVKRALYTDGDLSVVSFRRAVCLSTIDAGSLRGDLADRLLAVELHRIEEGARRTDETIANAWAELHPVIVGGLADLAAQVLVALPTVRLATMPRMADFARLVGAVDKVLGTSALDLFLSQKTMLAETVIEGDAVASAVRDLITARREWQGTATELLALITETTFGERRPPNNWPATGRGMSGALTRCAPVLRSVGLEVEQGDRAGGTGRRLISLALTDSRETPSQPSQPSPQPADLLGHCDGTRDDLDECDGPTVTDRHTVTPTVTPSQAPEQGKQGTCDDRDGCDGTSPPSDVGAMATEVLGPFDCPNCDYPDPGAICPGCDAPMEAVA